MGSAQLKPRTKSDGRHAICLVPAIAPEPSVRRSGHGESTLGRFGAVSAPAHGGVNARIPDSIDPACARAPLRAISYGSSPSDKVCEDRRAR